MAQEEGLYDEQLQDEFFYIKIKFRNINNIYKLLVDIPIDIASDFKDDIENVDIRVTFKTTNQVSTISQVLFIYHNKEYKARN